MSEHVLERLRQGLADDEQVRSLVEGASQAMLILDEHARVLAVNHRAAAFLDHERETLRGLTFTSLVEAAERAAFEGRLATSIRTGHGPDDASVQLHGATGPLHASLTFLPFRTSRDQRLALLIRETTPVQDLDRQARQLATDIERHRKLSDLGTIVSKVAHELKTPATYIENLATIEERKLAAFARAHPEHASEIDDIARDAAEIREGAQRIRLVLAELHPLTRNHLTTRAPVDLADLVRDALRSFSTIAGPQAASRIELDLGSTHAVDLDLREMSRVILNLVKNANEATNGAGRIRVVTRNRECPPQIRVEDDGPGVPPQLEARLFEPFFTTKTEGTGLGLAISERIVESNGGTLRYERAAIGGAAFVIEFGPSA